ncbi:RNA polymerase sigma factor [Nocardioides sp.]|uniref:RNA polymerase sigma factor n=1 Tax=Nocardioides sp. TaxID=35761 RepID=UPI0039E492BC
MPERDAEQTTYDDRSVLAAAVHALPAQQRATVLLRHWLGLSVAEAATELGISEGTVKSHTARGLAALRAVLEPTDAG